MDTNTLISQAISHLGFPQAELTIQETDEITSVHIEVPSEESGILIGYHGEKIEALKLVLSLMLNKSEAFKPVQVDVNDYQQRRQKALHDLVDEAVEKAVASHQEILLPPLNSSERRIIHMYVADNKPEVTTYSEGEGSNRRLVVRPSSS